jgi:peptide-methionine (S)-S-oxide reductase
MKFLVRGFLSAGLLASSSLMRGTHGFVTSSASATISPRVALGAGCYWGTEKFVKSKFEIKRGEVGFMHPDAAANVRQPNPSYKQVCSSNTGYVEVYDVELANATEEKFEALIKHFFTFHDPTTMNAQGNDRGTQYASFIFCYDQKQVEIANKVKAELQGRIDSHGVRAFAGYKVTTEIVSATAFYKAHDEHQLYLDKNPGGYCNHKSRFSWEEL